MNKIKQVTFRKGSELTASYNDFAAISAHKAFQDAVKHEKQWIEINYHNGIDLIRFDSIDMVEMEYIDEQFEQLKEELWQEE